MRFFDFLYTPFARPKKNKNNFLWILVVGFSASIFILLYKPFGISNETGPWYVDLIIFSLGPLFVLSVLFIEWYIPSLFPKTFNKWTLGKAILWYSFVILFLGAVNFIYKSFWGGFSEFTWIEFLYVLARTSVIGITVSFFVLGIWHYFNRNRISRFTINEDYKLIPQNGQPVHFKLKEILYISSDDNYVDIHYESNGKRSKMVLRSSLKNIESQLVHHLSPILRCHRRYLINVKHFKIHKSASRNMVINLAKYDDEIPVSNKYAGIIKQRLLIRP